MHLFNHLSGNSLSGNLRARSFGLCAVCLLLCAQPAWSAGANDAISIKNRPLIAGLWMMPIADRGCIEYYNFQENGEFVIKSEQEWTSGSYEYTLPPLGDPSLPMLVMKINHDNNQVDCSGNKIDQSNEVQQQFVRWSSDQRNIEFCNNAEGQQCYVGLNRLLP